MFSFAQSGGAIVSQWRWAARRQSVIQAGSPLRAEIARTTPSSSPGGKISVAMSVTKPAS